MYKIANSKNLHLTGFNGFYNNYKYLLFKLYF